MSESESAKGKVRVNKHGLVVCRVCGCTQISACDPPCAWVEDDLCSGCGEGLKAITEWADGAHRPNLTALVREFRRQQTALVRELRRQTSKCPKCHGTGKVDRGNGTTKPCDCTVGSIERLRRRQPKLRTARAAR